MEMYNDILAVTCAELTTEGVMTYGCYKKSTQRHTITVIRRGGGYLPALISWSSVPSRYKDRFISIHGDPEQLVPVMEQHRQMVASQQAIEYFQGFTFDNGVCLDAHHQREYLANSMVLDWLSQEWHSRRAYAKVQRLSRVVAGRKVDMWGVISREVMAMQPITGHSLPSHRARLSLKLKEYQREGYRCLISKKFFNSNSEKLTGEAKEWLLAHWATPVTKCPSYPALMVEYNEHCKRIGAKAINSVRTITNFLEQPDVMLLWQGSRRGYLDQKATYSTQFRTMLPTMRDSIWYTDGTRLNLYYQEDGKRRSIQVYEVMDAYSEVLLGHCISKAEDFATQERAIGLAIKRAGTKPYQLSFDNQSGLTSKKGQAFTAKMAHLAIRTQPYNGSSKTIEAAFGRLQSQLMKRHWMFSGQNITATSAESRANMEFIGANDKNLPTLKQVMSLYEELREQWNAAPHPSTGIPRVQMYEASVNPQSHQLSEPEMIELFWVPREREITYSAATGLIFTNNGVKMEYMMCRADGLPDQQWNIKHNGVKLRVLQDPDDTSHVAVYTKNHNGYTFGGVMAAKTIIHRGIQEQEAWESGYIKKVIEANKQLQVDAQLHTNALLEKYGLLPEQHGLTTPNIPGVTSSRSKSTIGKVQKVLSNMDLAEMETAVASCYGERTMANDISIYTDLV